MPSIFSPTNKPKQKIKLLLCGSLEILNSIFFNSHFSFSHNQMKANTTLGLVHKLFICQNNIKCKIPKFNFLFLHSIFSATKQTITENSISFYLPQLKFQFQNFLYFLVSISKYKLLKTFGFIKILILKTI